MDGSTIAEVMHVAAPWSWWFELTSTPNAQVDNKAELQTLPSSARCRSPSHAAVTGRHRSTARPRRLQRAATTQHRTRRVREEGGSTGSTGHDSVIAAVLGLLLHGDAVGPGGEVRLGAAAPMRMGDMPAVDKSSFSFAMSWSWQTLISCTLSQ